MKIPAAVSRAPLALLLTLIAAAAVAQESQPAATEGSRAVYDPGEWTLHGYASASLGNQAGEVYQLRIGGERHWASGLAFEISGAVGVFNADAFDKEDAEDGQVAGFDLIFRWYFHRAENWAMYTDAGAGAEWFSSKFPSDKGTSFEFEPQAGVGFTHRIGPELWFFVGARWHHLSNASILGDSRNRGYDAAMPYFGLTWLR